MRTNTQRLWFLSASISALFFSLEPVLRPALAAAEGDISTVQQGTIQQKPSGPSAIDRRSILKKSGTTTITTTPHRLLGRSTSPHQAIPEVGNDGALLFSRSSSRMSPSDSENSQSGVTSPQIVGPSHVISSAYINKTNVPTDSATPLARQTTTLLGSPTTTSMAAATAQPGPIITQRVPASMRRLMSEMPGLMHLVTPSRPNPAPSPDPVIGVSSTSFLFSAQQGQANPITQTFTVTNRGGGILNWQATTTSTGWLTLSPASGTGDGVIQLTAATSSLTPGTYTALIILQATGAAAVSIPISLALAPAPVPSTIRTNPASLSFTAAQGSSNPSSQNISITTTSSSPLSWSVVENVSWLSLSPSTGTGNGSFTATASTSSLPAGTYNTVITISTTGASPVSIPVTFMVTTPSTAITFSPTSLTFSGVQGGANPANQTMTVNANGNWSTSSNAAWLTISPSSGHGNGSVSVSVDLSSTTVGTNSASITLTSNGVNRTASVTLTVATSSLTISRSSLSYTATQGTANPSPQTITISSNGTWTASGNAPWLSLSPTSGSNNGTITASINTASVNQKNTSATITVISGGIVKTANVTLTLNAPSSSSVTLTWNANSENDLGGYRVYRATTSGIYGVPIATLQGNVTTYQATGLQFGTTYYFVVTAYDIAGNESAYSNEVSKSIF
jgi:hypothetical protein